MNSRIKQELLRFNTPRRIIQFISFILFSAMMFDLAALPLLLPILWTWGFNPNITGDAFSAIQFLLGGWGEFSVAFPWLALASFLIVGVLIGKSLCGWVCPFGLVQDLIGYIRRKKKGISPRTHESMIYIKYGILAIALFVSITFAAATTTGTSFSYQRALGIFAQAPFTTLSPAETLFAELPKKIINFRIAVSEMPFGDALSGIASLSPLFWVQLSVMIAVLVFSAYVQRGWCKYLCPHGGLMAIMNWFSFLGLRRDLVKCTKGTCRLCVEICPMKVPILDLPWEKFSDPECIYCMKCRDACPEKAIRLKYP